MLELIEKIEARLAEVDQQLMDPVYLSDRKKLVELNRERRHIAEILEAGLEYRRISRNIDDALDVIRQGGDDELVAMAREELTRYEARLEAAEQEFKLRLLPRDPNDDKPAIVEIRAGTGGDEAGLFVADVFRMYQRYADRKGWKLEILSTSDSIPGAFKEIIFALDGDQAYGLMKFESGVHRVQRVPATEAQGRIHTSAITVAVLPEAEEVEVEIREDEIRVDVYRSTGHGGQSVNTTDSAVRITHLPTGLVVTCQDEKSQIKNRAKALKVLRARLYDKMLAERDARIEAERRSMVSTGDRSAKIRTYNFPQSRVTDHRIGLTLYRLNDVLGGDVDSLIEPLRQHDQAERLKLAEPGLRNKTR